MLRSYSEAYKWAIYEKRLHGTPLTQLCEETGVSDNTLRTWFSKIEHQYARARSMDLLTAQNLNRKYQIEIQEKLTELSIIQNARLLDICSEMQRIACAKNLLPHYGPNLCCRVLKIRKSNLYYHLYRAPKESVYDKHDQKLRPAIRTICAAYPKQVASEKIRQKLMAQGFTVSKRKVLELLRELDPSVERFNQTYYTADGWQKVMLIYWLDSFLRRHLTGYGSVILQN